MKHLLAWIILGALCTLPTACSDADDTGGELLPPSSDTAIKSILAYAEHPQRERDTLDVSYNLARDTLYFTTRALPVGADPVDLQRVHLEIEVHKEASVNLTPETPVDLTREKENVLTITAGDGHSASLGMRSIVTPPYEVIPEYETTITELWTRTGAELGLAFPQSCRDLTVAGDYLLVLDNTIDYNTAAKIKAYDKTTGAFVKDVPIYEGGWTSVRSYTWTLQADEAGHFAIGRLNSGGAGFWMDVYADLDAVPTNPFKLSGSQVPENAGKRMQILGNLLQGEAWVCLTNAHYFGAVKAPGTYSFWTLRDGMPTNGSPTTALPTTISYGDGWHSACVQRASLDDPMMYITYNDETGYPSDPFDQWETVHAARFVAFTPGGSDAPLSFDPRNFKYRVLDAKVFNLRELRLYFTLQQGYSTGTGAMCTLLYNLSGKEVFRKTPASAGYDKVLLHESEGHVAPNDQRYGSVAVTVDEAAGSALLYAYYPGQTPQQTKITCLRLQLGDKIE